MNKAFHSLKKLRATAARSLKATPKPPLKNPKNFSSSTLRKQFHELQLHQIEVEIQNTELVESRNQIEELLENFTDLYDNAPVGYFTLAKTGKILQMNLSGAQLLGTKNSKLIGQLFGLLVIPKQRQEFHLFLDQILRGVSSTSEIFILQKNNRPPVYVRINAKSSIIGKECRLIVTDISDRKVIEEQLRLTNVAITSTGDAISITNAQGIIDYINPAFTKITGFSESDIIGKKSSILKSGVNKPEIYQTLWKTILAGKIWQGELVNRHKNGNHYVTEQTISPVILDTGEITHFVCVQRDITDRRLAEIAQQKVDELAAFNKKLEEEILLNNEKEEVLRKNNAEKSKLLLESQRMQYELRELSRQVISIQEEERQKISRELHDVISQTLSGINLRLALLKKTINSDAHKLEKNITQTQQMVEKSVKIVQQFARELRPSVLDDLGLIPALQFFLKNFSKRTSISHRFTFLKTIEQLKMNHRTVLFRIAQEALNNVARHAQATNVTLKLISVPQGISMVIHDNGKSFNVDRVLNAKQIKHLGLLGMRERIGMVGGSFAIKSIPRQGTKITVVVPFLKESIK